MINEKIYATVQGVDVKGQILEINEFYIKIIITSPFVNWENQISTTGPAKQNPNNNYLITKEETSKKLLIEVYKKIKIIDESLDRICRVYDNLIEEVNEVESINNLIIKKRIINKLNHWFYNDFLFSPSVTGLVATITDVPKITEIIETYKTENRKIYLR